MAMRKHLYLSEERMTFGEHLEELRRRLINAIFAAVGGIVIALFFQDPLMAIVLEPHRRASTDRVTKTALHMFERAESALRGFPAALNDAPPAVCLAFMPEIERERALAAQVVAPLGAVIEELRGAQDGGRLKERVDAFAVALGEYVSAAVRREMAKSETPEGVATRFARVEERFGRLCDVQSGRVRGFWSRSAAERLAELLPEVVSAIGGARARALAVAAAPDEAARLRARALSDMLAAGLARIEEGADAIEKDKGAKIVALQYTEQFFTYIKIAFIAGLFIANPFILYNLWRFIGAGLYAHEQRIAIVFVPFSFVLFVTGCLFGYFLMIPWGLSYLGSYGDPELVDTMLSIGAYLSLFLTLTLVLGLIFQVPLVMFFLAKAGLVRPETFARVRRYQILGTFVFCALLTPPDPFTQSMLAVPVLVLYEIGILCSRAAVRGAEEEEEEEPEPEEDEEDDA
ncbi:MAG TPA: twin-arginine translocase subunit TatC [Planctomycetes bacterium]|nr:twin-arginine translocase subunit TatC [Planctomycetota bacterium]